MSRKSYNHQSFRVIINKKSIAKIYYKVILFVLSLENFQPVKIALLFLMAIVCIHASNAQPVYSDSLGVLKIQKDKPTPNSGFFHHLVYGTDDGVEFIPINSYRLINNDSVVALKFIDDGVEEEKVLVRHR